MVTVFGVLLQEGVQAKGAGKLVLLSSKSISCVSLSSWSIFPAVSSGLPLSTHLSYQFLRLTLKRFFRVLLLINWENVTTPKTPFDIIG